MVPIAITSAMAEVLMTQGWPQPELIAEDTQPVVLRAGLAARAIPFRGRRHQAGLMLDPSAQLRLRARLLEFLKFRVLASQEA